MKTKMKRYGFKFTSAFLAFLMVFYLLPVTVFADMLDTEDANIEFVQPEMTASPELENDVFEVTDKRTANTKTFHLSDGTYYVAQYVTDVHYMDENNVWQDIDNRLILSGSEITTSNAKIKFAKKTTGNSELFTLHDGNRKLTLSLDGAKKKVEGQITNHVTELGEDATQLQKMTTLDQISASVLYANILNGVDLEYVINGINIKENIIVKERSDAYSYSFTLSLNNLNAALNQEGEVIITDSDNSEVVYVIPAPVMWDANNTFSTAASMSLTSIGTGKYTLTVTADSSWMNAEDRAYPVTVDPPIYTNSSSSVVDLDIQSSSPNYSAPNSTSLFVSDEWRTYWKLTTLPAIPNSAYITNAQFTMTPIEGEEFDSYVAVYEVLNTWDSTLTWNKTISATSPQGTVASDYTDYQHFYTLDETGEGDHAMQNITCTWDITPIVKNWYAGSNYGLMFAPAPGTTTIGIVKFRSNEDSTVSVRPQLCIKYRDMKGVEDYWSYSSQSAGFAGTGSVNHATGNLVFSIPTLTSIDALIPISPTLVYNSGLANSFDTYPNAQTPNTASYAAKGFKLNINETLLKKAFIDKEGETVYYFIWADGDGTEHYFMPTETSGTYEDEDGLLLTLKEESASCTITDANDTVRTFSKRGSYLGQAVSGWALSSITDKNGNKVTFVKDSSQNVTTISLIPNGESAIEQLKIAYQTSCVPYAVWNPTSGEGVILRYSTATSGGATATGARDYLRQVVHAHGGTTLAQWNAFYLTNANVDTATIKVDAIANYTYDSNGNLLTAENTLSNYKLSYAYTNNQVTSVKEYGNGSLGQQIGLTYGYVNTVIRTSGSDDVYNTSDDLLTTYGFDFEGRAVSCYTTNLDQTQFFGSSNGQYVGDENEKAKNNLKSSVQTTHQSPNYLMNGGFESGGAYWTVVQGNATFGEVNPYLGEQNATLSVSSSVPKTVISQNVGLEEGEYTISMYVNALAAQNAKAYIRVQSNSNASNKAVQEIPLDYSYATDGFLFTSLSFSSNGSTSNLRQESFKITIEVEGTTSESIFIDNVMLSKTIGAAEFDMVQLGQFEESGVDSPFDHWEYLSNSEEIVTQDTGNDLFHHVLVVDAAVDEIKIPQQVVYQASDLLKQSYYLGEYYEDEPMLFTLSGWAKGTAQSSSLENNFLLRLEIKYSDGESYTDTETLNLHFSKGITDWQFISGSIATNPSLGMVDTVTVRIVYTGHSGVGYFDNISVVQDSNNASFYTYNSNGRIESSQRGRVYSNYSYNDDDMVKKIISSDKTMVEYDYDDQKRVKSETHSYWSPLVTYYYLLYSYTYNNAGLLVQTIISDIDSGESYIETSSTYNTGHIYGTVKTETDSLGKTTEYFYDESNGRLNAVLYPEGNGVYYEYDEMGNLQLVLPATVSSNSYASVENSASVDYAFDDANRLSSITTDSTVYTFTYDSFGNSTSISAGDYTLASYTYNPNNGKLSTLTYGNGLVVRYSYDVLDRVEKIEYNVGTNKAFVTVYSYSYDSLGNLARVEDHTNDTVTEYKYDLEGRLAKSYTYDAETYRTQNGTSYGYDDQSRLTSLYHTFDYAVSSTNAAGRVQYTYAYDDAHKKVTAKVYAHGLSGTMESQADMYGRADIKKIDIRDKFYNHVWYDYHCIDDGDATIESTLVSTYTSTAGLISNGTTTTTFHYVYDDNGNITQIKNASGVVQYQYTYDDLGQLIREDNRPLNKSYTWTYDNAGNRLTQKTYAFTTGTLGTATNTKSYGYSADAWGDKLTSYNGTAITHDAVGNPVNMGGEYGVYLEWQGRQLMSHWDADADWYINFTYNDEGIRTSKLVGDYTLHEYILNGSQIIAEKITEGSMEHLLVYVYDEAGSPIGLIYRNSTYASGVYDSFFFEKNLQGDIVAVYNSTGEKIGAYTYDAWGNFTTSIVSGSTSLERSVVGSYNPFRYRGYYYDTDLDWYYLQSRYYNPQTGRFLNADGYASTGQGLLGYNMYVYCGNDSINKVDPTGRFWIELWENLTQSFQQASGYFAVAAGISQVDTPAPGIADILSVFLLAGGLLYCSACATYDTITAPTLPSMTIPKAEERVEALPLPPTNNGTTYYHVTTPESAFAIKESCVMLGSDWEGGYVYAWKIKPNQYAIDNSGAHTGVIISFKTNATFEADRGISNPRVLIFGPVVSAMPGPIVVWDVEIVGD